MVNGLDFLWHDQIGNILEDQGESHTDRSIDIPIISNQIKD